MFEWPTHKTRNATKHARQQALRVAYAVPRARHACLKIGLQQSSNFLLWAHPASSYTSCYNILELLELHSFLFFTYTAVHNLNASHPSDRWATNPRSIPSALSGSWSSSAELMPNTQRGKQQHRTKVPNHNELCCASPGNAASRVPFLLCILLAQRRRGGPKDQSFFR